MCGTQPLQRFIKVPPCQNQLGVYQGLGRADVAAVFRFPWLAHVLFLGRGQDHRVHAPCEQRKRPKLARENRGVGIHRSFPPMGRFAVSKLNIRRLILQSVA